MSGGNGPARNGELWTRWRPRNYRPRTTLFLPAETVPTALALTAGLARSGILSGPTRVMLVGPMPFAGTGAAHEWAAGELAEGCGPAERGHYFDGGAVTLRYLIAGHEVEVTNASTWFGDGAYTAADAGAVWRHLSDAIAKRWDGAVMLSTPATLGRDLFVRGLGYGQEFPVMSGELQELIRHTSGQGRIEVMAGEGRQVERLVAYDGRMMYAGCVRELGHGIPVRDRLAEWDPYARGRYHVDVTVPEDWRHVGLLPAKDDGGGWEYPAEPGRQFSTWVDGAELHLAAKYGWAFSIRERIIWPEQSGRPLDKWARDLLAILDGSGLEGVRAAMLRAAVRALILHGIGAFHGRTHRVSRSGTVVPAGAKDPVLNPTTGLFHWWEGSGQAWPELAHPEWSAAVWGRARARLLTCPTGRAGAPAGMLHVDPATIVGVRTDAIYMTADPAWPDDGKVGRLRPAGDMTGPATAWPKNGNELLRIGEQWTR